MDHGSSRYDALAGNGLVDVANGFGVVDAATGNGMVATAGASQPTALKPSQCQPGRGQGMCDSSAALYPNAESKAAGDDTGLHQELEELHYRHGNAGPRRSWHRKRMQAAPL